MLKALVTPLLIRGLRFLCADAAAAASRRVAAGAVSPGTFAAVAIAAGAQGGPADRDHVGRCRRILRGDGRAVVRRRRNRPLPPGRLCRRAYPCRPRTLHRPRAPPGS